MQNNRIRNALAYTRYLMKQLLKFICILILSFVVTGSEHACAKLTGQARIDSLIKELSSAKEDTNEVNLLNSIAYAYNNTDPETGITYAQKALRLAETFGFKKGIAGANSMLGVNYMSLSDYPKALEYLLKALKQNEDLNDKKAIAGTLGNIGNVYIRQADYTRALEYYFRIQKTFEELGSKSDLAITFANIANVYFNQNDLDKALEYNKKAIKICDEIGERRGRAANMQNIGNVFEAKRDYTSSLQYDLDALKIFEELGDKHSMEVCLGSIGDCYLTIAKDSIKVNPGDLIPASRAEILKKSIEYSKKSIALCTELGNIDDLQSYAQSLSEAEELAGNYKDALDNYKQYVKLNDSVFGSANKLKLLKMETQLEIGLKNKQIEIDKLAVAKKKNERSFYIVGIVLLLLVIVFIWRNYRSQKKSNAQLSVEKQRSEDLLLNILPAEVADELKNKGTAAARYFDNVTVMFTDFVNFTQAGERMSPQELIDELHTCFKTFDELITKYNIEKIKTIGDAYLAVSGLPIADAKHAENIVRCAIEINTFMRNRQQQLGDKTFEVRIGIHSGSVVAGIVGVKKFAYDIWGDTVNTAARIEENSASGKINISQTTYELVKDKFACTYRGNIVAKNKGELSMYFVEYD